MHLGIYVSGAISITFSRLEHVITNIIMFLFEEIEPFKYSILIESYSDAATPVSNKF